MTYKLSDASTASEQEVKFCGNAEVTKQTRAENLVDKPRLDFLYFDGPDTVIWTREAQEFQLVPGDVALFARFPPH